jgi:AcrR family transcriptional regulator
MSTETKDDQRDERPLGQRELQRLETRRSLAEHAIRLFSQQGFDQTTVDEIASAAGVSTRTFFLHFPTKAAAAFPDHQERIEAFTARLMAGAPTMNPLLHLRQTVLSGFEDTTPSRLVRYTLLDTCPELRDEDARSDRDYEEAIAEFLLLHWGREPEAVIRANAIANAVIGTVRAAMVTSGRTGVDGRRATAELLQRMLGSPFEAPLGSLH